jgi:hypothetical protein
MMRFLLIISSIFALLVQGDRQRIDGIGFSGGGFLGVYELGVLEVLIEKGIAHKDVPMAGASAGSIVASIFCSGASFNATTQKYLDMLKYCADGGPTFCLFRLDELLNSVLEELYPKNVQGFKNCRGKLFVQITRDIAEPPNPVNCTCPNGKEKRVSYFRDREDLISAIRTSSFVSQASSVQCFTKFRTLAACDGAFTHTMACPPLGKNKFCLRIGTRTILGRAPFQNYVADIYPGLRGFASMPLPPAVWDASWFNVVLVQKYVQEMLQLGRDDTRYWLAQNGW